MKTVSEAIESLTYINEAYECIRYICCDAINAGNYFVLNEKNDNLEDDIKIKLRAKCNFAEEILECLGLEVDYYFGGRVILRDIKKD